MSSSVESSSSGSAEETLLEKAASPGAACRARLRSRRSRGPWAHNLWRGRTVGGVHTLVGGVVQVYHVLLDTGGRR